MPQRRTASPHPGATPSQQQQQAAPAQAMPHGSPTRVYLNTNVTPHLLEGMKLLAANEPEKPLKWLADFLAAKSKEVEGT
ncbi:putative COMPASS complex subunit Sdc1 [Lineolata rhizophorae]|uniref:Putative COMPASS complex subunit Sdc1 n=1 Tax=Lineolata rhizophorae TaxID=578093 RepID=A0A6A6P795_9PEZI|nr:putative COMPASS complex subunit Sdc1 [Lineolata rhizophorae]